MSEGLPLFVGISTKNGLKWNEAKGRVFDGTLFVQTPQGEQGMPLLDSSVNSFENEDKKGPQFCFSLQLGQGASLPMGASDSDSRDAWVKTLEQGIEEAIENNGGGGGGGNSIEIMEDSSEEETETKEYDMTTDREKVAITKGNPGKKTGKMTQLEEDESGVIGVVCEGVELAIEREAQTEDDAVNLLRSTLGTNEDFALDRAIALWCKRFDVDMPDEFTEGDNELTVIAKWMFWVIQARTLLRARFGSNKDASSNAKKDPLEDLVLGEWAGELELNLNDIQLLYVDEQLRDDVTRDLAFWFANKAQAERIHALEARGGASQSRYSESDLRSSTVIRRSKATGERMSDIDARDMNRELALLVKKKKKEQAALKKKSGSGGKDVSFEEESSTTGHLMRSAQMASSSTDSQQGNNRVATNSQGGREQNLVDGDENTNGEDGGRGEGLVVFDEMSGEARLEAFKLLSSDEKAEVLIDLTPVEREPLIASLTVSQVVELIAMDDVVLALNANELLRAGETALSDRALAITRLGRLAKFKLFTLEGRAEAMEIEQQRRATLSSYDPNAGQAAIDVAVAARVNLYHLLDHRSRIEVVGAFTDRRERTDLLKALTPEDRQDFIDACITAEMGGNREWFNGWDWFDWFDFNLEAYDSNLPLGDGDQAGPKLSASIAAAYVELIAEEDRFDDEEMIKKLNDDKQRVKNDLAMNDNNFSDNFSAATSNKYTQGFMEEFNTLGSTLNNFGQSAAARAGVNGLVPTSNENKSSSESLTVQSSSMPLPLSSKAEFDRLASRDVRLRDLEDNIRKVVNGDGILRGLLDDWRKHKTRELECMSQLAAIKRVQAGAAKNESNDKALAASAGVGRGVADQLDQQRAASTEEANVRAAASLEAELEQSRRLAAGVEESMALARKSLLPSAIDRTDVALLAQRVSVSYLSEIELMKNNLHKKQKLDALKDKSDEGEGIKDGEDELEDLKLKVFTLELENARLTSENASTHRLLVEQTAGLDSLQGINLESSNKSSGGSNAADTEVERLKKELVATRTRVTLLSEDSAKTKASLREFEARAKLAEDDAAKRKLDSNDIGNRYASLKQLYDTSTAEAAWLKQVLEGMIASKDQAESKLLSLESKLATISQLDPHRWHAGRQNVRLENELRAAREERDRAVSRMSKDVAHFKAEMALAADKLERSEAHLLSTLQAAKESAALAEAEQTDLVKRNLAIQALLTTANSRLDAQSAAFDELRLSHMDLEKATKENSAKVALYERRAAVAEESLNDARTRLVSLTKTHELMKAAETRRVLAYNKEKLSLESERDEATSKLQVLNNALIESRTAGQEVARGLEASKEKISMLEQDTASLLEQEAEMRAALSETKNVLLTVTADYRQRMQEAALVSRQLRTKETELAQKTLELKTALASNTSLKNQLSETSSRAELSASRVVALQRRLAAQGSEVDEAAGKLMKLSLTLEPDIARNAEDSAPSSEGALQMGRLVELQRCITALTGAISKANELNENEMKDQSADGVKNEAGKRMKAENKGDVLNDELAAARDAAEQLETLAQMHMETEEPSYMFSDTVLMTETERILSLIDSVEARPVSASLSRPSNSQSSGAVEETTQAVATEPTNNQQATEDAAVNQTVEKEEGGRGGEEELQRNEDEVDEKIIALLNSESEHVFLIDVRSSQEVDETNFEAYKKPNHRLLYAEVTLEDQSAISEALLQDHDIKTSNSEDDSSNKKPIIVFDRSGERAALACSKLAELGCSEVYNGRGITDMIARCESFE